LLLAAYNDAAGVTANFNKNVLLRINRELDANFVPDLFRHRAVWNPLQSRMEMHLESLAAQQVSIAALALQVHFAKGETIHTENSYKFTDERVSELLEKAGFALRKEWNDSQNWFGVYLATAC
jgi:L-histidine Nalpha-methyltransferase